MIAYTIIFVIIIIAGIAYAGEVVFDLLFDLIEESKLHGETEVIQDE
jgi:hypothetical protein